MSFVSRPLTIDQALANPRREKGLKNNGLIMLNVVLAMVQILSYATSYNRSMISE